jgi:hypothetical protein
MQFFSKNTANFRFKKYPNRPFWLANLIGDQPFLPDTEQNTSIGVAPMASYGPLIT